jgi:hypothetical protein
MYYEDPNKGTIVFTGDLILHVGDTTYRCLHTPGHTRGQLAVHVPEEGVVFTGDPIFNGWQACAGIRLGSPPLPADHTQHLGRDQASESSIRRLGMVAGPRRHN